MRLYATELKKVLSSRVLIGLLTVLVFLNFALAYALPAVGEYDATVREVYAAYLADREAMDAYYAELEELHFLYVKEEDPPIPYTYSGTPEMNDYAVLSAVKERAEYIGTYGDRLAEVIRKAERQIVTLHGYGYSDRTYTTGSQILLRDTYAALAREIDLDTTYSYGYDDYFAYGAVTLFLLVFLTAAGSYVFLHDGSVGFRPLLKTTRRGGRETATAKLCAAATVCIFATVLFLLSALFGVGLKTGYSTPFADVQTLPSCALVPRETSVLGYLLAHSAFRLLAALVYTGFVCSVASTGAPYAVCYAAGALFAGGNAALFDRDSAGTAPPIRYLNLASMAEGCELLGSYRTTDVFRIPVETPLFLAVLATAAILLCSVGACVLFPADLRAFSGIGRAVSRRFGTVHSPFRRFGKRRRCAARPCGGALVLFELKKNATLPLLLPVLLLLLLKIVFTDAAVGDMARQSEALYYGYVTEAAALDGEARDAYLRDRRAEVDAVLLAHDSVREGYLTGRVSAEDYGAHLQKYYDAKARDPVLTRVESYARYLARKNAETGLDGEMIYSSGYEALFALPPDFFLCVAVLLLSFRVFSVEDAGSVSSGGFLQILRTTKKGRTRTFVTKFGTYTALAALLGAVFRIAALLTVRANYLLPAPPANLYAVQSFSAVTGDLSIGGYLAVDVLLSAGAAAVLAAVFLTLSLFLKKPFAVLSAAVTGTVLPALVSVTVLPALSDFAVLTFTAPQTLFLHSAEIGLCGDLGYLLLVVLLHLFAAAGLTAAAHGRTSR